MLVAVCSVGLCSVEHDAGEIDGAVRLSAGVTCLESSQAISDAMVDDLRAHDGEIVLDHEGATAPS